MKFGKRDVAKMAEVLNADFDTAEEAAVAALEEAEQIIEGKARFTVVGQLYYGDSNYVDPTSDAASKVALGWYGTEKQGESAAYSLTYSTATHEEFRAWVLPVHHGTPASWFQLRKKAREAALHALKSPKERHLQEQIRKHNEPKGDPQ